MRILFVGDLSSYARAKQRYLALKDLGHKLEGISWVPEETDLDANYQPSFWERFRRKVGYPLDLVNLNQKLLPAITKFKPDLFWIEKANTIWYSTYCDIKTQFPCLKIVYYSEDDVYVPNNRSAYLKRSFPIFDVVYTTKPRNVDELPKLGARRVFCIYQAYDCNVHRPLPLTAEDYQKWGSDVAFVGTFERDRAEQMLFLAQQGIKVRVWGSNWSKWKDKHPNLQVEAQAVYNDNFIKVINSTKINLNFLRKANRDQHTNRSLEIPACSSFMLAERTEEHLHLFTEGKEAEFFDSLTELLGKVKFYLAQNQQRKAIASSGRQRCINSGYSHHERLKVMLEQVQDLPKSSLPGGVL